MVEVNAPTVSKLIPVTTATKGKPVVGEAQKGVQNTPNQDIGRNVKISSWNIRRGLITREQEIKELLRTEDIDILFLEETDVEQVHITNNISFNNYKIISCLCKSENEKTRMVSLVKDGQMAESISVRIDLMSTEFPSIWLELRSKVRVMC